jgi:cytochrome P450
MVYGIREGVTDRFTNVSAVLDELLRNNTPGMWLVDGYPQLRYLPKFLQWWRPTAEKVYQQARDSFMAYYELMEKNIATGKQKDCFALKFYTEADADNSMFDFDQRLFTIGGILQAGSDTTRHQMNMIFVAMATDPGDWIVKARKELDEVCGDAERLPRFDDWHRLPYIHAIVKESMRWRSNINQTGFPHALTQDDEFEGYKLPAGTVVTINNWALAQDPREYEDPLRFKPERFLNEDLYNPLKGQYGFGVGSHFNMLLTV